MCHLWFWGISRSEMVEWLGAGWDLPEGLVPGAVPSEGQAAACGHAEGPGMAAGMTGCWRNFGGSVCKWLGCQGIPVVLMAIQGKGQIAVDDQRLLRYGVRVVEGRQARGRVAKIVDKLSKLSIDFCQIPNGTT